MAQFIQLVTKDSFMFFDNIWFFSQILDFGSGKGYLGHHIVSNHHDIQVVGIEMDFGCSSSAKTMAVKKMKSTLNNSCYDRYSTVTHTVNNDQPLLLENLIKNQFNGSDSLSNRSKVSFSRHVELYLKTSRLQKHGVYNDKPWKTWTTYFRI